MAIVEIAVGKSKYKIECESAEQEKLLTLATKLNEKVNYLTNVIRNADEKTILVVTSLMIMAENESEHNTAKPSKLIDENHDKELDFSANLQEINKKIELLINKVKNY